jgi:hypothetical protein
MATKILIMGLPGSGKTTLATWLKNYFQYIKCEGYGISVEWFNADDVRKHYDDWDFSREGRIRQSKRMNELASKSNAEYVICDFVAPLEEMRENFAADWTIWVDTIDQSRFEDTDKIFQAPTKYDFRITEQNAEHWAPYIGDRILNQIRRPTFDWRKETVQMLGRWQPWHAGHRALFERSLAKTGQVIIQIRDCQGWNNSNPFAVDEVINRIHRDLDPLYQGQFEVMLVPNIINITYGRDVGYKIEQEIFDDQIHAISATKIREEMKINGLL